MKLLTFLGAADYKRVRYSFGGGVRETEYVQEAIAEILEPEEVVVFATRKAMEKHGGALERRIGSIRFVEIDIPKNEEGMWSLFDSIIENVSEHDSVAFDLTHSFRHIPFISFFVLLYLQVVKDVQVEHVLYGAFELGREVDGMREVPILDLTRILELANWVYCTRDLKKYGRMDEFAKLIREINSRLHREERPKKPKHLSGFSNALEDISDLLHLNLVPSLMKELAVKRGSYEEFKKEVSEFLKPAAQTLDEFERLFGLASEKFGLEHLEKEAELIDYLLEKGLFANAMELMRELLVNIAIYLSGEGESWLDWDIRKGAEDLIKYFTPRKGKKEFLERLTKDGNELLLNIKRLGEIWSKLEKLRNSIAHAGMTKDPPEPETVKKDAYGIAEDLKKIIGQLKGPKRRL